MLVGFIATVALLVEIRLPVSQDTHFLLEILWLGVAMGGLFVTMLQPALASQIPNDFGKGEDRDVGDVSEWCDSDRIWLQQHPDEQYPASDIDKKET